MISGWWLVLAFFAGGLCGLFLMAIVSWRRNK